MKQIAKLTYLLYAVWAVACIVLFIFGKITLVEALSFLWFPLAVLFVVCLWIVVFVGIGNKLKGEQLPDSCETCVFGKSRKITGVCIGETDGNQYGQKCKHFTRSAK